MGRVASVTGIVPGTSEYATGMKRTRRPMRRHRSSDRPPGASDESRHPTDRFDQKESRPDLAIIGFLAILGIVFVGYKLAISLGLLG